MKNSRRLLIFGGIAIVVIAASAAVAVFLSQQQSTDDKAPNDESSSTPVRLPAEEKADDADKMAREGDVEGGVRVLDEAIRNTDDSHEQFIYYSRKATLLFNHDNLNGAFDAALKAHELEATSDSSAFVGQIARQKGDAQVALEYYKKAITLIDQNDPFADEDKTYYESIISDLEAA